MPPMNIMPSTPRFMLPDFSVSVSPSTPKSSGAAARMPAVRKLMRLFMLVGLLFCGFR